MATQFLPAMAMISPPLYSMIDCCQGGKRATSRAKRSEVRGRSQAGIHSNHGGLLKLISDCARCTGAAPLSFLTKHKPGLARAGWGASTRILGDDQVAVETHALCPGARSVRTGKKLQCKQHMPGELHCLCSSHGRFHLWCAFLPIVRSAFDRD
jgi:hypothetical protein